MKLVLDIETTLVYEDGRTVPSPYDPRNSLISVGYVGILPSGELVKNYMFFHPNYATPGEISSNVKTLQAALNKATIVIGHNLKFDMSWLYEVGFKYDGKFHDTMIFEYVACKGLKLPVSLEMTAKRYELSEKKDILKQWIKEKKMLQDMPKELWLEYGEQDIETTLEVYQHQRKRYEYEQDIKTMWPVIKLSNESLQVLIDIERAGISIDQKALNDVETQFKAEKQKLEIEMRDMARHYMGDNPVNFSSPEHMSWVVYSRKVKDKKVWAQVFNIGSEMRGSVRKIKYPKYYSFGEFNTIIKAQTELVYRSDVKHCHTCDGKGSFYRVKKDGDSFKKPSKCPDCNGAKVLYIPNGTVAGFRVKPINSQYATVSGFSTDKETINILLERDDTPEDAKLFLSKLQRLNAIDTYLTAFVEGIRKGIKPDGFCHPNFNQCVTATGRLSSSNPNWQNQPRGNTFPVRRVVVSRWAYSGGKLLDIDFAQLEYRTAVMLARCLPGLESIILGKDRHQLTAEVLFGKKKENVSDKEWKELRQLAKPDTFAPLYGSLGKDEKRKAYKDAFYAEHTGIARWHDALVNEALTHKQITTPSGRIFSFPNVKRIDATRVTGRTQILNYPVQSFATADIAWCVIVHLWNAMKASNVHSKIILQIHDSITIDTHPEEVELMQDLIKKSFNLACELLTERFKYVSIVPIGYEISIGDNLMDKKSIYSAESRPLAA